ANVLRSLLASRALTRTTTRANNEDAPQEQQPSYHGKIIKPVLFSDYFKVPTLDVQKFGLLDPILNSDTKLFIDPLLLRDSKNTIIRKEGVKLLRDRFTNIIKLVMASRDVSDAAAKAARRLLNLNERRETCLGYGGASVSGSSRPDRIKNAILQTTKEIVELGIDDPEIISLMGFLEEEVGPDTISDLTTNAIVPALAKITQEVSDRYEIRQKQFLIEGEAINLPENQYVKGQHGILLVPRDILRELPIATDWSDISRVAFENEQIRRKVNELIADFAKATVTEKKRALKTAALESKENFRKLFEGLLNAPERAYDQKHDRAGLYALREVLQYIPARYPHRIPPPRRNTKSELARVVGDIIIQFKTLVEKKELSDLLWDED